MSEFGDGIEIGPDFVRFNQRDDIFNRADWDPEVTSAKAAAFYQGYYMSGAKVRPVDGFTVRDYAYRNASWHIADVFADLKRDQGRHEGFTDPFTAYLAQYIKNLGYRAYASMNDSALAIPIAIQAGLGEYGRNGLLITPEFGPRLRVGRVYTDLPLVADRPRTFGVKQFCDQCRRCADACPVKAIPFDPPSAVRHDRSNLIGVTKWTVNAARCFGFWVNQNTDCSICIRVCPFNRDYSRWYNRWWRTLAATRLRGWLERADRWFGRGERVPASQWWDRVRRAVSGGS